MTKLGTGLLKRCWSTRLIARNALMLFGMGYERRTLILIVCRPRSTGRGTGFGENEKELGGSLWCLCLCLWVRR